MENFLQAMRTSKVFEDRIELINQLGISSPIIISNLHQVVEGLVAFWEESSCSGVSHCKFNISILHVAQRHLQYTDTCDIFSQYVILSTKASKWCRIHFHSFFTTKDSNEESHMTTFIQVRVTFGVFELCFCHLFSFGKVFLLVQGSVSVGSGGFYFRAAELDKRFNF